MRCWPGCDAYIAAPYFADAVGRVVHVERQARRFERLGGEAFTHHEPCVGWVVSGRIPLFDGKVLSRVVISDDLLRPIIPPPGAVIDEVAEPAPSLEPTHV